MKKCLFCWGLAALLSSVSGPAQAGSTSLASASDSRSYTQGCSPRLSAFGVGIVNSGHLNTYCSGDPCEIQLVAIVDNECCRNVSVLVEKVRGGTTSVLIDEDFSVCSNGSAADSITQVIDTDADVNDGYVVYIDEGALASCTSTCEQDDTTITAQLRVGTF